MAENSDATRGERRSLRNPIAALANAVETIGESESDPECREQRRKEARKLRELAATSNRTSFESMPCHQFR